MPELSGITEIELVAEESKNLDTTCFRGSAPLAHLALISQADIFDQVSNPNGLQRDLSPKHASDAYEYVHRPKNQQFPRAFPEIVLNVRDRKAVQVEEIQVDGNGGPRRFRLRFSNLDQVKPDKVMVSRVDGNHRLFYASGDERREPLTSYVPFQLHVGLTQDQERSLFVDINSNQKGLNSSHLSVMQSRLSPEEQEIRDHLDRWIAKKLVEDPMSPWNGIVHMGGSKKGARAQGLVRLVNFASLEAGTSRLLAKSQYIHDLTDPNAQYILIRNYWNAVKQVFSQEWTNSKEYLVLRNMGVLVLSTLGGTILDRCIPPRTVATTNMAAYLSKCYNRFNWHKDASGDRAVTAMSGNRAVLILAGELAAELQDESGNNIVQSLQAELLAAEGTSAVGAP